MTIYAEAAAIDTDALGNTCVHPKSNVHHSRVAVLILIHSEGSNIVPMRMEFAIDKSDILIVTHQQVACNKPCRSPSSASDWLRADTKWWKKRCCQHAQCPRHIRNPSCSHRGFRILVAGREVMSRTMMED